MGYISLKGIRKCFDDGREQERKVLDGLDFDIEQGDFVAVTGVSGTGKTTLLNILGTLLKPDEGTYIIGGTTVDYSDEAKLQQLRNREIGFMFQDYRLLPQLTAWQNILLPVLAQQKVISPSYTEWAQKLVELMDIHLVKDRKPHTLSGGEKSRTAMCRALIMRPSLLLADEPTGQLDNQHAQELGNLLQKVNQQLGTTIVMVTHSDKLASTANSIYKLENGRLNILNNQI